MQLLREITTSSNFGNVYLQARLQLVVNVTNNAVELVDRVVIDIPRDTRVDMIPPTTTAYVGELMNVNITLSFGIRNNCPTDMYGSGCSVLCQPQDNELGHYFCNYLGEIICLDNYFQVNTNCSIFCEDTNNSLGHYTCEEDGSRVCLSGYTNPAQNCIQSGKSTVFLHIHVHMLLTTIIYVCLCNMEMSGEKRSSYSFIPYCIDE